MRRGFQGVLCFLCAAMAAAGDAWAAAWLQKEGHGEVIVNAVYYTTESSFARDGEKLVQPRFIKKEINPYIEYGLSRSITIGANASLQDITQEPRGETFGLSDIEVFSRAQIWRHGGTVISLQPLVTLPGFYDKNENPALGNGQADVEMRMLLGHGFQITGWNAQRHFANLEAAYRRRLGSPGDEVRVDGTLGLRPTEHTLVLNQVFSVFSLDDSTISPVLLANSRDYDVVKYQASVVRELTSETSLQLGVFRHIAGENTGGGGGALLSIWRKF